MIKYLTTFPIGRNSVWDYLVALALFVAGLLAAWVIHHVVLRRMRIWAQRTPARIDNFFVIGLQKILLPLLIYGAFALSVGRLEVSPGLARAVRVGGDVVIAILGIRVAIFMLRYVIFEIWLTRRPDEGLRRQFTGLMPVIIVMVWAVGLLFLLDNLGFKVSTIVAGLGIGGAAVALASQSILGDLFSYFSITIDRPFEIGDFIILGDFVGTVEHIGIKTTRVRSLGGELLIFSNRDLTDSRIRNYKQMQERRIVFSFSVDYGTPQQILKEIGGLVKSIIAKISKARFDRAHFSSFGESGLTFEVVYYVLSDNYNLYMDVQQQINLEIKAALEERGVQFAFPVRSLRIDSAVPFAVQQAEAHNGNPVAKG